MSSRRLALLGNSNEAWVSIRGMPNPHLRVCESKGALVRVCLVQEDQSAEYLEFTGDGEYRIPEASFVQVTCKDTNRAMICDIVARRVA